LFNNRKKFKIYQNQYYNIIIIHKNGFENFENNHQLINIAVLIDTKKDNNNI